MAVGAGAGALNPTKPITVNDMMEAIQPPGIQPTEGFAIDASGSLPTKTAITTVGGAGYTQVIDDVIVEVVEQLAVEMILQVGVLEPDTVGTELDDPDYLPLATFDIGVTPGLYSILRNNLPSAETWTAESSHVNERTFGPGALDEPVGDAAAVASTTRNKLTEINVTCSGGAATGALRVWIRSHYTNVNFGPGL